MALEWIGTYDGDPDYEFDGVAIELGEQIVARMEERGMTQADLARAMGVSRARVSQILRGNDNLTLKSIVAVAIALDSRVEVLLKPIDAPESAHEVQPSPTGARPLARAT
jgi:transcriptional regulator with XRE-family HTH domain